MKLLVVFFGALDRGILETHKTLSAFVDRLRTDHAVTVACVDNAVSRLDGVPRCHSARRLLNCDVHVAYSEAFITHEMQHIKTIRFKSYTPRLNRNAMMQLFSEQKVADYLRNVERIYDATIISSSDFLFMDEFDTRSLQNVSDNYVMTSMQQNGANGYTNGF